VWSHELAPAGTVFFLKALDGPQVIAAHERAAGKFAEVLVLDHYLEIVLRKPGALPGATALARAAGAFTASHQWYWDAARCARGDAGGTRALIEVLLGHRTLPGPALLAAMDRAVSCGVLDPQAVLIDARRLADRPVAPVILIGALARYDRPARAGRSTDGQPQSQPPTTTADLACSRNSSAPTKSHDSTRSSMSRSSALRGARRIPPPRKLASPDRQGMDRPGPSLHECTDGDPGVSLMPLIRMASDS